MSEEQMEQNAGEEKQPARIPKRLLGFLGIWLLECAVAAALLVLVAYVSFRMRFSAEVIRGGISLVYIFPCLLGGRMMGRLMGHRGILWGAGTGAAFYAVLLGLSVIFSMYGGADSAGFGVPVLCVLSGAFGAWTRKNSNSSKKALHIRRTML